MKTIEFGFTLLEMLIAVVIFAVVSGIAFTGLSQVIKIGDQVGESNERLAEIQFAMAYISKDWLQVNSRSIRDEYGDTKENILLADNRISWTRNGWSNLLQTPRSELQRVEYEFRENSLIRRHWQMLDRAIETEPLESVLISDLQNFKVFFLASEDTRINTWPDTTLVNQAGAPKALQVEFEFENLGTIYRILEIPAGVI